MGANSKIEWTDHTFNWWWGCQRVSAACDFCYAESMDKRTGGDHWGPHAEYRLFGDKHWNEPLRWNAAAERAGERRRVFSLSMGDWADNRAPQNERNRGFDLIRRTPWLDHLLLTKRPQNIAKFLAADWGSGYRNVWLGCTVENREEANRRIPHLLSVPAKVHFLSCEPLLGPIDLRHDGRAIPRIDWVICGGESGPHARPTLRGWSRSLRDQCAAAGIPFFHKQNGEWIDADEWDHFTAGAQDLPLDYEQAERLASLGRNGRGYPYEGQSDGSTMIRVGKKAAGRLLDGRTHDAFPEVSR